MIQGNFYPIIWYYEKGRRHGRFHNNEIDHLLLAGNPSVIDKLVAYFKSLRSDEEIIIQLEREGIPDINDKPKMGFRK